ncbi:putative ferric-chelate reductase 1 [Bufo gargarizans]|uniref:putative ferric-chelate reductase 1 n=1 Tax=Bufo gargarizans TaxID=30331 RepID=UPI001CF4E291|nr:putative ferric-chelate reductase 1 [Bufo gargarizans]
MALVSPLLVLWLLACSFSPVASYPDGRVSVACSSMMPKHGHHPRSEVLHNITVDKTVFNPGDRIKVTLSGSRFAGFFVQARNANNLDGDAVGSFSLIDDQVSQLLKCGRIQDSAVSQTNKRRKEQVDFYWIAPSDGPQHIQFLATVVEKYSIYWVKIPGPIISQSGVPPVSSKPQTAALPAVPPSLLTSEFSSSGCGSSKFCVRNPTSCDPQRDLLCFFLSFRREGDSMLIEMSGPVKGYLSFALSHDQWMGDDDVYLCLIDGQTVEINPAYNRGRFHPEVALPDVLHDTVWRIEDGILQCSFRRDIHIADSPERFPLDGSYYIFLADGDVEDGRIHRHQRQPLITSKVYNIAGSTEDVGGSRSPLLIKFHGAMMFIAWMTTVSIGVLFARFFKPVWPTSTLCGEKIWFQMHRILMVTTVLLTAVAFVLPFLYRGHWSTRAGYHPYLGCIVLALTVLQLILAVFRPPPSSRRRPLFNWAHWGTGSIARTVAVVAIFLGMDLQALDLPDPWDSYTMVGFVLWHVCIDILLEVHDFCQLKGREKLFEDRVEILNPSTAKAEGHTFKRIVLTIYICGNFAFLITFLAAINQL